MDSCCASTLQLHVEAAHLSRLQAFTAVDSVTEEVSHVLQAIANQGVTHSSSIGNKHPGPLLNGISEEGQDTSAYQSEPLIPFFTLTDSVLCVYDWQNSLPSCTWLLLMEGASDCQD